MSKDTENKPIRESFLFMETFEKGINMLSPDIQAIFYKAIARYSLYGEEPQIPDNLGDVANYVWATIWVVIRKSRMMFENGIQPKTKAKVQANEQAKVQAKTDANEQAFTFKNKNKKENKNKEIEKEVEEIAQQEVAQSNNVQSVVVQSLHSSITGLLFDILEENGILGKEAGDIVSRFEENVHGIIDKSPIPDTITDKNGKPINDIGAYFRAWIKPNLENVNGEYYDIMPMVRDTNFLVSFADMLQTDKARFAETMKYVAKKFKKEQTKHNCQDTANVHAVLEAAKILQIEVPQTIKDRYKELLTPKS